MNALTPALSKMTPLDRVVTAISILQAVSLASDSAEDGAKCWGPFHIRDSALDHAITLLIETLEELEKMKCPTANPEA